MTKTQKHISKLISKHVDWMVNWSVSEEAKIEQYNKAAKSIVQYFKGIERREKIKRFEINLKNEWKD